MKYIIAVCALALSLQAQQPPVNVRTGPPPNAVLLAPFDVSSTQQYLCYAQLPEPRSSAAVFKRTDSTLTNIVVSTNTATATTANAHNLVVGTVFTITGATVDTDLNGTWTVASTPSTTTFTFTTTNVGDATYTESTLVLTKDANTPILTDAVWSIQVLRVTANSTIPSVYPALGRVSFSLACSNRAIY